MINNVIKMDIYQPFAHYREPKIMQDDFIPTLYLPPATTVAGLITYLLDRQTKSVFKIGIIGTYRNKEIHFVRGENESYWSRMRSFQKKMNEKQVSYSEYATYFKDKEAGNRIMNFEVLQDVNLTIFICTEDITEYRMIKEALESPTKYLSLGRKEDFFVPKKKGCLVQEVTVEEIEIKNKRQAIMENLCIKNTYIPVALNNSDEEMENRLRNGVLYALPKTYKDLNAEKKDRNIVYGHYVYIDNNGYYPSNGKVQVYTDDETKETTTFLWL
ncbi:CRISPR-associated protein Cas5 [Acetivibrio clariflavus]|uniref:CRISPR-associated protein Cas5 n=1 Tax=Acetivibrio clariflavus TaxID=288965 RepID=UPI0004824760|nr:CRISPR-associated protein Cas5 [Acetivibrio clariflavus]HOQ01458.1 CRISPR-associated protein Cas5 [Acetivibrio clariflavus]